LLSAAAFAHALRYPARVQPPATALVSLGVALRRVGYEFVTVTPETHQRVHDRAARTLATEARTLRDVFGWNSPFARAVLPDDMFALLQAADALDTLDGGFRSRVRFSTLQGRLFVHSAFPTVETDAVFFGPDTYRFCSLLARWTAGQRYRRAVDLGCGSGAGGIVLAECAHALVLADINTRALAYAEVNTALAGISASIVRSDLLRDLDGEFDLIVANPPYMRDASARTYRDGGGEHGEALSVRIVREGLSRLGPQGTLIVYTGAAVVNGVDRFYHAVEPCLRGRALQVRYEELDPDVFGDELERPGYADVERIAAVGLKVCVSAAQ
jgi:release factor glutamine methyltransferase